MTSGPITDQPRESLTRTRRRAESELFDRLARDRDGPARAALLERFMPLARRLARRYYGRDDADDLEQIAAIGLLKAIDHFEPDRGLAFSTFAFPTILGELKHHFRDRGWIVRVPRDVRSLAGRIDRLSEELLGQLGRAPTVSELADRAAATPEQVLEALQAATARQAISLDQPRYDSDGSDGRDVAVEEPGFAIVEDAVMLEDLMRILSERERMILTLRFRDDYVQSQIAELTGETQMRISRLIRDAVERLHSAASGGRELAPPKALVS
jgi:RNA polymerase sigma-B factor